MLRAILENVIGLLQGQQNWPTLQGIVVVDDLIDFDEDTLDGIFPKTGNLALTGMAKMKLKSLRVWERQKDQELNQDQEVDVKEFTVAICQKF